METVVGFPCLCSGGGLGFLLVGGVGGCFAHTTRGLACSEGRCFGLGSGRTPPDLLQTSLAGCLSVPTADHSAVCFFEFEVKEPYF